jgi:CHAT domain-containing protein
MRLDTEIKMIEMLIQRLRLNLRSVSRSPAHRMSALTRNAQGLLSQLYDALIAPLRVYIVGHPKLIIVPHGTLHYLPFHALYDGFSYLLERHEIGYLPSASSLRYCLEDRPQSSESLAIGYSQNGRLPYAAEEARHVADILGCRVLDEEQATQIAFRRIAPECRTLHLAAHGDFRFDNPLFSGLIFADGWLTTMDIFNLRLKASLVTLSACQTGRNVIGGGDELLGLMRAFLGAGAASVALTLWAVEDRSTAQLMETFYQKLIEGYSKGAALREAQLQFIHAEDGIYTHPYFWAPFFLVGDTGEL